MSSQVRERVSGVEIRKVRLSARRFPLSPVEIAVGTIVLLFFFGVVFYYFSSLRPEQQNLARLETQLDQQREILIKTKTGGGSTGPVTNTAKDALDSLALFKTHYLKPRKQGERALIDEINSLVKKHNARLTSGLEMSLENTGADPERKKAKGKSGEVSLSVFPKLNVNFTISGQYDHLRAFIAELEKNKQFLVIRSLNFTTVEESGETESGRRSSRAPAASGLLLSVNLAAHFQP